MDDDPGAADDERAIELSSIAAIYPELMIDDECPFSASLDIAVTPTEPLKIQFHTLADGGPPAVFPTPPSSTEHGGDQINTNATKNSGEISTSHDAHYLSHLPPLHLKIKLSEGYPSQAAPIFQLSTYQAWLRSDLLKDLAEDGLRLWEELGKDQVVFAYIDHLQQAAEKCFGLAEDTRKPVRMSNGLKISLLDFDIRARREKFEKETFDCGICLEPKKGSACHRLLLCSHVFCVECLKDFYKSMISEGDVDAVKCLTPNCGKDPDAKPAAEQADPARRAKKRKIDRTLNPSELLQIPLEQDIVQRYVFLKRKKKLESDKNTIYCPRQWCQGAARSKKHPKPEDPMADAEEQSESDSENPSQPTITTKDGEEVETAYPPPSERLAICEDCSFAFCSVCKKGWHGELLHCNPRKTSEVNEEERLSMEYLNLHTSPCPTCSAPCQKTHGCNHMICFKCKTHFCYLCSNYLMESNPYAHFNDKKSSCYMRLWELEGGDGGEDVGLRFNGGVVDDIMWDDDDMSDTSSDTSRDPEEPIQAPAIRRPLGRDELAAPPRERQIEIVNFARAGAANQRVIPLHDQNPQRNQERPNFARVAHERPVLPAPMPPPRLPEQNIRRVDPDLRRMEDPDFDLEEFLADLPHDDDVDFEEDADEPPREDDLPMERAAPAPGQGNHWAQQPPPVRAMGLERFLQLAAQDQEDEWDSDELEDADEDIFEAGRRAAQGNRNGGGRRRADGGARGRW
ncbi:MAG: hypothetical protein Q9160_008154 [Pyrenula sp. 1 TL-2023]